LPTGKSCSNTWYTAKLEIIGTTIKAYLNGNLVLTQTDGTCTAGSAGLGSYGASFEADDVRVTTPTANTCVQNWRDTACDICSEGPHGPTQDDTKHCYLFLDCYAQHNCGPESCGEPTDVCGVNQPGLNRWGSAPKLIADQVYTCLGCAGAVKCNAPLKLNGTPCTDGNACTQGDQCQSGVCIPGPTEPCQALDQCHEPGTCSPATGQCSHPVKADNSQCNDGNACTQTDTCQGGACVGGNAISCPSPDLCHVGFCDPSNGQCDGTLPVVCQASDECHAAGACDLANGQCSNPPLDKIGCNINIQLDAVVDMGGGKYVAVFGHNSTATQPFHPTTNEVTWSPDVSGTPKATPPYSLIPGVHSGTFMPSFTSGQTVTWTVDGTPFTASASIMTPVQPTVIGNGLGIDVGGTMVMITPDTTRYLSLPDDPGAEETDPGTYSGDEFRGALTGQLTVGPTGQAIYTVPIAIPPGIAGIAPNLSLVYNSQGPNGIAGQGWSLSGLSMIYRCSKTRNQDGYAQPVALTDDDTVATADGDGLCIDGKRLYYRQDNRYETESQDFSVTKRDGNSFEVRTKSGEFRSYNYYGKAHVLLPKTGSDWIGPKVTVIWALDNVRDRWGNYYELHYLDEDDSKKLAQGGLQVQEIRYTGHTSSDSNNNKTGFYSVFFDYEDRQDTRTARFYVSKLPMKKRLTKITTDRGVYTLSYKDNDLMLPSRLAMIEYCSTLGAKPCVLPLKLDWEEGGYGWKDAPGFRLPSDNVGPGTQLIDLDGDGRADFVSAKENYTNRNGVWRNLGRECNAEPCQESSAWDKLEAWKLPDGVYLAKSDGDPKGVMFADFDGDGRPDLLVDKANDGKPALWFNRLTKNGGGWQKDDDLDGDALPTVLAQTPTGTNGGPDWSSLDLKKDQIVDIDADGKAEIVHFGSTCCNNQCGYGWTPNKHGLYVVRIKTGIDNNKTWANDPSYTFTVASQNCSRPFRLVDINRDGLSDLAGAVNMLNMGDRTKGENNTVWKSTDLTVDDVGDPTMYGDLDGDGQHDRITQKKGLDPNVWVTAGIVWSKSFDNDPYPHALRQHAFPLEGSQEPLGPFAEGQFKLADVNADGLVDVVVNHSYKMRTLINRGGLVQRP
jgi:hypothetical protein